MDMLKKIYSIDTDENEFEDYLFFDIEVFKYDSLVVFKNYKKETVASFWNGEFEGISDVIREKVLVGYNNYSYDDYILEYMRRNYPQEEIKELNDDIITTDLKIYKPFELRKNYISLDCMQQLTPGGKNTQPSLKKIEANLGKSIVESSVDFNIDRPLTEEEKASTLKYCEYDVESTIDIFKLRFNSYFLPKFHVIKMLNHNIQQKALRWNTTTIAANFITCNEIRRYANHELSPHTDRVKDNLFYTDDDLYNKVPQEVVNVWERATVSNNVVKESYTHEAFGCSFEFGFGGLHGINDTQTKFHDVYLLDVTSMYPNILVYLKSLGEEATERFKRILQERITIKRKDPVKANAYKLILNSIYGQMKNEYSNVHNPKGGESVCIYGQIALFDLCRKLYDAGYTLININTDGVAFNGSAIDPDYEFNHIVEDWEKEYHLQLELTRFKTWIQKDVNNYVAIDYDQRIKVKGADVNAFLDPKNFNDIESINFAGSRWNSTNSVGIVAHCLVNKLLYNKEPYETVLDNINYPLLFQMVLHTGTKYKEAVDVDTGVKFQKVNRIFAAKETAPSVHLVKQRVLNGKVNTCSYPNAPERMFVYNDDLSKFSDFTDIVDFDYYIKLADKAIERWIEV